jgi:hypothetical protein
LGAYFVDPAIAIDSVEVDVEGKHGADLGYTVNVAGGSGVKYLSNSSDNGPDSGTGDNEIAEINNSDVGANFTEIAFTADGSGAELSIEGGGDGAVSGGAERIRLGVTHGTLFKLVTSQTYDGELDCGGVVTDSGVDGEIADTVTVTRQNNKVGGCIDDLVAYNLEITNDVVIFEPNIDGRTDLNFLVQIDWVAHDDPFNPPPRLISLDGGVSFDPVVACLYQSSEGTTMLLDPDADDTFEHPGLNPNDPPDPETNPAVPWCMAGERQVLLGEGEGWQQIQWYDGAIDPRWSRS